MGKKFKKEPHYHQKHPLKSRRDFIAAGLVAGYATYQLPNMIELLLGKQAFAQALDCGGAPGSADILCPIIHIDCAGGGGFANSFIPSMNPDSYEIGSGPGDYEKVGMLQGDGLHPNQVGSDKYGAMLNTESGFYNGFDRFMGSWNDQHTHPGLQHVDFLCYRHRSDDDSNGNSYGINGAVSKIFANGAAGMVTPAIGASSTPDGGRSVGLPEFRATKFNSQVVNSFSSAEGLVSAGGLLNLALRPDMASYDDRVKVMLKKVENMNSFRLQMLSNQSMRTQLEVLFGCSSQKATAIVQEFASNILNPTLAGGDTATLNLILQAFDVASVDDMSAAEQTAATMCYLTYKGLVKIGKFTLGGFDYHDGTANSGHNRMLLLGELNAKIARFFILAGSRAVVINTTDGAVRPGPLETVTFPDGSAYEGTERKEVAWLSDQGSASSSFCMFVTKNHLRTNNNNRIFIDNYNEVGRFVPGGGADLSAETTSNNVGNVAKSILANIFAFQGEGDVNARIGEVFDNQNAFAPLAGTLRVDHTKDI